MNIKKCFCTLNMLGYKRSRNFPHLRSHDELPFRTEGSDPSEYMEHIMFRKITKNSTNDHQSIQRIEEKEIDEYVLKALIKLTNTVQEYFCYEHQANFVQRKNSRLGAAKDSRENRVGIIRRDKMVDEIKARSYIRNEKLKNHIQNSGRSTPISSPRSTKKNMYTPSIQSKSSKSNKREFKFSDDNELLKCNFETIIQLEKEKDDNNLKMKRIKEKALAEERRQLNKENVENTISTIRNGMNKADTMLDSYIAKTPL